MAIYALMTFYVVSVFTDFSFIVTLISSVGLAGLYPLLTWLQHSVDSGLTYRLHYFANVQFGATFIGVCLNFVFDIIALAVNIEVLPLYRFIALVLVCAIALYLGNTWKVETHTITNKKIRKAMRLVHLSDQHVHGTPAKKKFEKVLKLALEQTPDVIAITGDLIDRPGLPQKNAFWAVRDLKIPVLFTFGNHEFYVGEKPVTTLLDTAGVKTLRSSSLLFEDNVLFHGLDDAQGGVPLRQSIKKLHLDKKHFQVLLYHRPTEAEVASKAGIDLMLTGHTHAGQIFPFNFLVRLEFPKLKGFYDIAKMQLYVSPGAGTWGPPMRLGTRNTITVFDLKPE